MDRAQFLQGLRTGGPRSASYGNPPLSANPTATRFASNSFQPQYDDPSSQLADRFQNMNMNSGVPMTAGPDSAFAARLQQAQAQQQQNLMILQAQSQVAALLASQGGGPAIEAQAMQLQMQMEIMRLQALQQQHQQQLILQNQLAAQQQQQQQQQQQANQNRRLSELHQVPSTAGPLTSSFPDPSAAQTRTAVANQLRARAAGREASILKASASEEQVNVNPPMTAAVGGKFGNRAVSSPLNPNAAAFVGRFNPDLSAAIAAATRAPASEVNTPATPTYGSTTVISGGTSLGGLASPNPATPTAPSSYNGLSGYNNTAVNVGPTKSDSATSWRRGSATPSGTPVQTSPPVGLSKSPSPPLRNRSISPPMTGQKLSISTGMNGSPTDADRASTISPQKIRPSPLRFASPATGGDGFAVARSGSPSGSFDGNEGSANDNGSCKSSPTSSTPPSSAGSGGLGKEREEASRKLYEGLGLGRPSPSPVTTAFNPNAVPFTMNVNVPSFITTAPTPNTTVMPAPPAPIAAKVEPIRQPMGPPCSVDELGPMNFASRLRKKAVGGLSVLMEARERREACGPVVIGA